MATAVIKNTQKQRLTKAKAIAYGIINIVYRPKKVEIKHTLPFRVRFTTITVPGYSSSTVPPIGIQVIGFSNYIL